MPDETDTTPPPQDSSFKIPSWVWVAGLAAFIGIIVIAILIFTGGSSNEDPDDETPGPGEKEEETTGSDGEEEEVGEVEEPQKEKKYEYTGVDRVLVKNESPRLGQLATILIPSDVSEVQKLTLQFERNPLTTQMDQTIITFGVNYPYNFEYLVYHIKQNADEESVDSFVDCEDEEWQEIYDLGLKRPGKCANKILYDLTAQPGFDYKYNSMKMTIDRYTPHGTAILEKLRANNTLEVFLRITGLGTSGGIASVRGEITYY